MSRLSRWSERKREAVQDEESTDESPDTPAQASDADTSEAIPLPDPDDLAPGSEISAFMASGVGEALRRRALRRLFAGDQYGVRDGLDDYDDDYRRLQPLAGELAERLRRWIRPTEETTQDNLSTEADGEAVTDARQDDEPQAPAPSADGLRPSEAAQGAMPPTQTLDQG